MLGCRGRGTLIVAFVGLLCSCSATQPGVSRDLEDKFAKIREEAKSAVTTGINRQTISPEEEADLRAARTRHVTPGETIWLQAGKSRILEFDRPIRRVAIGDPDLASIVMLGRRTIMLNAQPYRAGGGGGPEGGAKLGFEDVVASGITLSGQSLTHTHPLTGQPHASETSFVVWTESGGGDLSESHTLIVADFLNQQVLLEVTIAELDRTSMEQHGVDFRVLQQDFMAAGFMGGGGGTVPGLIHPSQPLLPLTFGQGTPTYAFIWPNEDVTAFIRALQSEGLATVLAEPKLLAMSGQNALFQAGGEIPIRIATGFAAAVQFKPFGTLVNFIPRVSENGDITLTVTPEVSQPDFSNEVEGIPTFRTRRASTSTILRNGETLIIGGLLQTLRTENVRGVPYLKDIPYIGYLFRNTNFDEVVTELMVVVKPVLVRPLPAGTDLPLPTDHGPFTAEEAATKASQGDATRPRFPFGE
jgi:Flp pilus assembly secretin CpaC